MSRIPIASVAPAAAPTYRANMLRRAAVRPQTPRPARAHRAHAVRPGVVKAVHRRSRKAATAPAIAARTPTPFAVAQEEAATPAAYALIGTTICESAMASGPVIGDNDAGYGGAPLSPEDVGKPAAGLTPIVDGIGDGPGGFIDYPAPEDEPTLFPPVGGGGGNPPLQPPLFPPDLPVAGVPEPATWALFMVGFGGIGAAMRRRRSTQNGLATAAAERPAEPRVFLPRTIFQETRRESQ